MNNIRLFLDNNEIELSDNSIIAITRQFEEITNPTIICNDWSKTIDIPFTTSNNKIFGNLYNPDRVITEDDDILTGLYFDPFKKIPFRLEYQDSVIMTGYAKNIYSTQTNGVGYYSITLNGELGKVFQEMQRITFDPAEEETQYIIDSSTYVYEQINKELIYNSWNSDGQSTMTLYPRTDANYNVNDIIGFMPNNSLNTDSFDYKNFQLTYYSLKTFTDVLEDASFEKISGMTPDTAIPDGLSPRGIGEYRSYMQIPYIYFNKLFKIVANKTTELTGYNFILDSDWFTNDNPYWRDLTVVLNPLDTTQEVPISQFSYHLLKDCANGTTITNLTLEEAISTVNIYDLTKGNTSIIVPEDKTEFTISKLSYSLQWNVDTTRSFDDFFQGERVPIINFKVMGKNTGYIDSIAVVAINGSNHIDLETNLPSIVNHITRTFSATSSSDVNKWQYVEEALPQSENSSYYTVTVVDDFNVSFSATQQQILDNDNTFYIQTTLSWATISGDIETDRNYVAPYQAKWSGYTAPQRLTGYFSQASNASFTTNGESNATTKLRSFANFDLSHLWNNDVKPFDIILNYTKLFRLIWEVDEANSSIYIKTSPTYFNDYTIKDWTDKLDMSNKFEVKPISFEHKYVKFNYEDSDAELLKQYKELYGINYGDVKLITDYNFNTDTQELFENLNTSLISTDNTLSWSTLYNDKDVYYSLPAETSLYNKDKDNKYVSMFGSFLFRNGKVKFDTSENLNMRSVSISDDTFYQQYTDNYCYSQSLSQLKTEYYPNMSLVYGDKCCLINIPVKNYTYNTNYFKNVKGIYEQFWAGYLKERYNKNNKIITCYLSLSQYDFSNFKFSDFIKIKNQVYIVNKIYDYNPANSNSTKVELINIQDITGYTTNNFQI